jgi:glycosyltransferase involved in cell wall biosynthesis
MLVANDVTDDSRVRKSAATAAAAGCEVLVVGMSATPRAWEDRLGPVRVVRCSPLAGAGPVGRLISRAGYRDEGAARGALERRPLSRIVEARRRAAHGYLPASLRGAVASRLPPGVLRWRQVFPHFVQMARAMGPVGDAFGPDLVHAHDFAVLEAGAGIVARARARGRRAALVYDAHEYVRGFHTFSPARLRAAVALEAEHIRIADRVLSVSPVTAGLLEAEHGLSQHPEVLMNAPLLAARDHRATSGVRASLGLAAGTPLLVYPGVVKPERGLEAVVAALPALPGVHLALVTHPLGRHLAELRERAGALGCADRLHVVPYVPTHQVSSFIADATIGIHPILAYGNAGATLPNKLFEYIHAGLPVVVSDNRASRDMTERLGIGEVFAPGDATDFARAVRAVLDDLPAYHRALAEPGLAECYSWEAQAHVLVHVYGPLLEGLGTLETPTGDAIAAVLDDISR